MISRQVEHMKVSCAPSESLSVCMARSCRESLPHLPGVALLGAVHEQKPDEDVQGLERALPVRRILALAAGMPHGFGLHISREPANPPDACRDHRRKQGRQEAPRQNTAPNVCEGGHAEEALLVFDHACGIANLKPTSLNVAVAQPPDNPTDTEESGRGPLRKPGS